MPRFCLAPRWRPFNVTSDARSYAGQRHVAETSGRRDLSLILNSPAPRLMCPDGTFGSGDSQPFTEIRRIIAQIRVAWPEVKIILRGDSGFCPNELMTWCETQGVDFVFGLARNQRLRRIIGAQMHAATEQWNQTGKPARVFTEFDYQAKKTKKGGWDRARRVAAKAEHIDGKENPRFVVTSLTSESWVAQALYEQLYCARGDMENRIKEQFSLFADRVSAETMRANQMRLYLSAMAYILVSGLRRLGLQGTELADAQISTIRTRLLKIGAQIRVTVRKVWVSLSSSYPWQSLYRQVWVNLRC